MKRADTAMHQAKKFGGRRYEFFSSHIAQAVEDRFLLERGLRQTLERGEVEVVYQPVVRLPEENVHAVEALARCRCLGEKGFSPAQFIPVAETGLIQALGEQVLEKAAIQIVAWESEGWSLERVAVNVSPVQLGSPSFPNQVASVLHRTGLAPERLELEITEESLLRQEEVVRSVLEHLKELGVRIALDDLGTGYSSPSYLRRLPIDRVKIDREFVRDIPSDTGNQTILRSLLELARGFDYPILAEGVETRAERDFLQDWG
ncbi:MAG: putative bifunctional diguanylate cyclase/phosphodiesterase, partial [Thiohalorhabdaceae bacterium]